MTSVTIQVCTDVSSLGEKATSADLDRYRENLANLLSDEFGVTVHSVWVPGRSGCEENEEINRRIHAIESGDEWIRLLECPIPATREAAIAALVESDVARWGEGEREASKRHHAHRTYGLALNELANRAELAGKPDPDLRAAAKAALTSADRSVLLSGG